MPKSKEPLTAELRKIPITSKIRDYRYLTCQGGGVKGGGFGGVAEFLEATKVSPQIEVAAGSSVGAMFVTLFALGYTAKEIREEMINLDLRLLQDKESPGLLESSGIPDLLQGFIPKDKKTGELPVSIESLAELVLGKNLGIWKGDALLSLAERLIARKTGKPDLTFRELAELNKANPNVFKKLILTGTNLTTKDTEYYSAEEWPDMPIADAVRISASFPGAFMPVTKPILKRIDNEGNPEYSMGVRSDGGLRENLPDVFNRPPYYQPTQENPANPKALAFSFKEKPKRKQDKYDSFYAYLKGLFASIMSEVDLTKKYKDNIVYIDTIGVDTLDFNVGRSVREALSDAGWNTSKKAFEHILEQEKNVNLDQLSLDELLQRKAFLLSDRQGVQAQALESLARLNQFIQKRAHLMNITPEALETRTQAECDKMDRFLAAMNAEEMRTLSDEALMASCKRKLFELGNVKKEQILQIKELRLLLAGLELRKVEFQEQFQKKHNKEWVERLESHLGVIKNLRERLQEISLLQAECQRDRAANKRESKLGRITQEEYEIKEARLKAQELELILKARDLKNEKDTFISGVVTFYQGSKDELMMNFFKELKEEFDTAEKEEWIVRNRPKDFQKSKYVLPERAEDVIEYVNRQQEVATRHMKEARQKLKETNHDINRFNERFRALEYKSFTSKKYENLKILKTELDRSIYEKTSFIAKINNYFVSDKPSSKNYAITFGLQFVAFTAFMIRVAAFGALSILGGPLSVVLVSKLVKNYNSEGPAKASADRFLRAFSMPDLFKLNKLRYLSRVTADAVTALEKNYTGIDSTEHAYIHKLFQIYLKKSGLKFEDIFPMKEEDSRQSYKELLERFRHELDLEVPGYFKGKSLTEERIDEEALRKFPIYKNFEAFHEQVKEKLKQTAKPIQPKVAPSAAPEVVQEKPQAAPEIEKPLSKPDTVKTHKPGSKI